MIILRMRANFGKLNGELILQEGMNMLCLPNEAGKSTWSAFLLAMLYGVPTTERNNKDNEGLPVKERYKPWNGSAMEGSMELLWNGRKITVERTASPRAPMGKLRAYETDSGANVPELTAENCGQLLCGVERSVFERTAFIRQLGLQVNNDTTLEKRLSALVTTGEDGAKTYLELNKALQDKRKYYAGRNGTTIKLAERESQLKRSLQEVTALQESILTLTEQLQQAQAAQADAQALLQRYEQAQAAQKRAGLQKLEQELVAQRTLCEQLAETAAKLPTQEALHTLQRQLETAQGVLQTTQMEAAFAPQSIQKPTAPPCFAALSAEQAVQQAQKDTEEYEALRVNAPKKSLLPLLLAAIVLVGGIAACFFLSLAIGLAIGALGAVGVLACLLLNAKKTAKAKERQHKAELLLLRYGVSASAQILPIAQQYQEQTETYEQELEQQRLQKAATAQKLTQAQEELEKVLAAVREFAPKVQGTADGREAIAAAQRVQERLLTESRACEQQAGQLASMRQLFGQGQAAVPDAEALNFDEAKLNYEYTTAEQRAKVLATQLAQQQGRCSVKGDIATLQAELEQTQEQLAAAQEAAAVVDLCTEALTAADNALRARFSPQITGEAAQLLDKLTEGKYRKLLLAPDMRLSVSTEDGITMRPSAAMSCGTADQMYFALRLAMCRRLLPENAPLLLDDALVNFDDRRTAVALELLREEAKQRQVIFFTCRRLEE